MVSGVEKTQVQFWKADDLMVGETKEETAEQKNRPGEHKAVGPEAHPGAGSGL